MTPMPPWNAPDHLAIPVNERNEGPVDRHETVRTVCWCNDGPDCKIVTPAPVEPARIGARRALFRRG